MLPQVPQAVHAIQHQAHLRRKALQRAVIMCACLLEAPLATQQGPQVDGITHIPAGCLLGCFLEQLPVKAFRLQQLSAVVGSPSFGSYV